MKVLFIGDVIGQPGCAFVRAKLPNLKREYQVDLVIANGENSAVGNGVLPQSANHLFDSGVDVITLGNHAFRRREIYPYLEKQETIIRPANYPPGAYGRGVCVYDMGRLQIAVVNLIGLVYLSPNDCPFRTADRLLEELDTKLVVVDFHAEATGEKGALGYYLDGRVSAVLGTHTHVQTSDARILPKGTGFQSDVGMTGPMESVLGIAPQTIIQKTVTHLPVRFEVQDLPCMLNATLLEIDESNGHCVSILPVKIV